jgi:hypothetical protein
VINLQLLFQCLELVIRCFHLGGRCDEKPVSSRLACSHPDLQVIELVFVCLQPP